MLALVPLLAALLPALFATPARANACVEFDSNFNLYVLGLSGGDKNLGAQSTWSSPSPQAIATSGAPPYNGNNTRCFLSQYNNAIYVLDGDSANPANVYIYDATGNAWSMTTVTTAGNDPTTMGTILDHDTNVFFALSGGQLYQLDFGSVTNKDIGPQPWTAVESPSFSTTGYNPDGVMAIAQNHIHFLDVPGNSAGEANIFVIHFSYFQPQVQSYPGANGANTFPEQHGQVASFFDPSNNVQQQFAFIPDDFSATYIINVENNSTIPLVPPTDSTPSLFAASPSALVQLTSAGSVYWMPFDLNNPGAATNWTHISGFGTATTASSGGSSTSAGSATGSATGSAVSKTGSAASATGSATGTSGSASSPTASTKSGAVGSHAPTLGAFVAAVAMMAVASLL